MKNLDRMRVVRTWGAQPADLDLHVSYLDNHKSTSIIKDGDDANLDIDHTDRYGPETITVEQKYQGQAYVFAVHDFTHGSNPGSAALSMSQAKVFVYVGQSLVRSYNVPRQQGNLWTVFRINGEGEIQDINTMCGVNVNAENVLGSIDEYNNENMAITPANQGDVDSVQPMH